MTAYEVGDTITHETGGGRRTVTVDAKYDDVKNGRPGFDGTIVRSTVDGDEPGQLCWGYDEQILERNAR